MNATTHLTPEYWEKAKKALSKADPVMKRIIKSYAGELGLTSRGDAYGTLVRSIIGQQVSVKVAESMVKKLEKRMKHFKPEKFLKLEHDMLREAGLSRQKIVYITELSKKYLESPFSYDSIQKLSDDEVKAFLVAFKGIGEWTAEMFMIFFLNRPDVFPIKDIGIQKAIEKQYDIKRTSSFTKMIKLADNWRPYRTVATWYLWRSLDPIPVSY